MLPCVAFHICISLGDMFLPKEEIDKSGAIAGIALSFCIFDPALECDARSRMVLFRLLGNVR
jgi:hypothetical protein